MPGGDQAAKTFAAFLSFVEKKAAGPSGGSAKQTGQVTNPWFKSLDAAVSWPLRVRESIMIEPRISLYNVFNFANFSPLVGQLTYFYPSVFQPQSGGPGAANGTTSGATHDGLRTNFGSGVYNAGAPRQMEFGVKVTF